MKSTLAKMLNRRTLSRALALLAVLALLAGCGGAVEGDASGTDQGAATQAPQETQKASEPEVKEETPSASSDGAWRALWDKPEPGTYDEVRLGKMSEPLKLKVVHSYDSGTQDVVTSGVTPENSMWMDIIREQLNIEFEFMWVVPSDQWNQRFQLSLSAGDIPDLLRMNEKQFRTFVDTGSLRDLTETYANLAIPELLAMDDSVNGATIRQATVDGKLLAIPRYEDNHASVNVLWYRADWAKKMGIPAPQTMQDVITMAEAFGNQADNAEANGIVVQKNVMDDTYALGPLFQCYGAYPKKWIVKDGNVVPGIIQDEMLSGLKAASALYKSGAIPKDFAALSWDAVGEMLINSRAGIAFGKWWSPDYPLAANVQYDPEADWALAPIPGLTAGTPIISSIEENMVSFYNAVYVGAPPQAEEALIKLLNLYFVQTFPASNDTWPQKPLPTTEEEHNANVLKGQERRKLGLIWNWCPVLTWNATENSDRSRIVNQALKTNDISILRDSSDKNSYDYCVLWLEKGVDAPDFHNNWRTYASRGMDDCGVLLTVRLRDEGYVTNNVFYGGATVTEEQVASTLDDMSLEYITKFIMGEVGEDSWAAFVDEWLNLGGQAWWDEVVEGYNRIH